MNTTTAPVVNPNVKHYDHEDIERLKKLVNEGLIVMQEVEDLQSSFNDTVKHIAEEIGVKPSQLKKVIKIAHKNSLLDEREKFEEIEDILQTIGRAWVTLT